MDTVLFIFIAFFGIMPFPLLLAVFMSNYIFKCGVEILFTPATYKITAFLKKAENEDYYDYKTDFNPFAVK